MNNPSVLLRRQSHTVMDKIESGDEDEMIEYQLAGEVEVQVD